MVDIDIPFWVYSSIRASSDFLKDETTVHSEKTVVENDEVLIVEERFLNNEFYATIYYNSKREIHRPNDKPAIVRTDKEEWFLNGKRERNNDLPAIIDPSLGRVWFKNNKIYRESYKPSFINKDNKEFIIRDNKHFTKEEIKKLKIEKNIDKF